MACRTIATGPGIFAIACGPRERRKPCGTPGCGRTMVALCDYPVTRKGKEATCDAKLCDRCRQPQENSDTDYCPSHQRLAKGAPPPLPGEPKRGECRIHIATNARLYVVSTGEHGGTKHVTFSQNKPGPGRCNGPLQTVPLDKWIEKTRAP